MKRIFLIILAVLLFLGALGLTLYPLISNFYNEQHKSQIHTTYIQQVEQADTTLLDEARERAIAYNRSIIPGAAYTKEALSAVSVGYDELLDITGSGIMGYIEIPIIDAYLPIYHGTGVEALDNGVGHLLGSSLPVGGEGTHAILTGHSGMATERMFTDITLLKTGDIYYLHILNEVLAYQAVDIYTVLPHDTTYLGVVPGQDLCTLVTCTPIGVNTHRLLVRGVRVPYEKAQELVEEITPEEQPASSWVKQYLTGLLLGLGCVFLLIAIAGAVYYHRRFVRRRG